MVGRSDVKEVDFWRVPPNALSVATVPAIVILCSNAELPRVSGAMPKKYDNTRDIPWEGDVREYLMNFAWTCREVNVRRLKQIWSDEASARVEKERDKWSAVLEWLEEQQGEA